MLNNWLHGIDNATRINQLALPGTHDSAAWTKYSSLPSSTPGTWAQRMNITEQLDLGIRVLDLRVGYASNGYTLGYSSFVGMFHGPIYLGVTFDEVLAAVDNWLVANPTEFVIMIFQQQGKPLQRDVAAEVRAMLIARFPLVGRLHSFDPAAQNWPTVAQLRGKVLALGRLRSDVLGFCDVRAWLTEGDNTDGRMIDAGDSLSIFLQDRYKGLSRDDGFVSMDDDNQKKFRKVENAALRTADPSRVLVVNHMSYSNLRYQPWQSGEGVNRLLRNSTLRVQGVLMIDDADEVTVRHILRHTPGF